MPATEKTIVAPIGGWDTRHALADMPEQNAPILDNWFPETEQVTTRRGYSSHATGMSGAVETLMSYNAGDGSDKLFAANDGKIYDVTSAGAVGAASVSSLTNDRWQWVQMETGSADYLLMVNGADGLRSFDGSSWATETITATGFTPANTEWINVHQNRVWFGEDNKLDAWYLAAQAKSGTPTKFPMGGLFSKGGEITAMGTWSRDSGDGQDDAAVFLTSEGQAAVYVGTDPSSASTWQLVGVFNIGKPIGRRCMIKAGSDLVMITQDGFVEASSILRMDRAQSELVAISKQINDAVNDAVRSNSGTFGWQPFLYPKSKMMIFNVPQSSTTAHQYVFNTITGAPCRFTGQNALCWAMLNDDPYFGGTDGVVYKADTGNDDNGSAIVPDALQAFSYLGSPGKNKLVTMIDPIFKGSYDPEATIDLNLDYQIKKASSVTTATPVTAATWGSGIWGQSVWGTSNKVWRGWRGISGHGRSVALRVGMSVKDGQISWVATTFLYKTGGPI